MSQWSKCSACDGKKGKRHRKVQCVRTAARVSQDDVQANLDACKGRVPRQEEECIGKHVDRNFPISVIFIYQNSFHLIRDSLSSFPHS